MKKVLYLIVGLSLVCSALLAQETLKFSAEIRPRLEMDNKDFKDATGYKNFTALRSRVGMTFTPSSDLAIFFQVQDSRDFGSETSVSANMKNLDVHQVYFLLKKFFNLPVDVKIGRMQLNYGSGRFIGLGNWGNAGKAFDGAIVTLHTNNAKFDFLAIKEKEGYNFADSADVDILGIFSELNFIPGHSIQPFLMWQKQVPVEMLSRFTAGIFIKGNIGGLSHEVDLAYQFGELMDYTIIAVPPNMPNAGTSLDINAYIISAKIGYTFEIPIKPYIGIGLDILSGDDNPVDNEYNVFTSPYGSKHKFYGAMDYFKNNPLHTSNLGMIDIRGGFAFEPLPKLNIKFDLHLLNSQEDYTLADGSHSKQFGTEGNLTVKYKYSKHVTLQAGASMFIPGEIFEETKGADNSTWFYLLSVVNL